MVQASVIALVAALAGIALHFAGAGIPFLSIMGTACIMGAFIIAVTMFLLFCKDLFFSTKLDELAGKGNH